ncbi:nitroreductase family protein [Mycoplasmopsis primatum]|uniref:nitroreductase family protein n=1 Tax=Mycoplasmopsis primatum TaxID=55604 RepID=UPI0004956876|nr:nitroreductase family protein [Mycoplasmopsis primatum]
MDFIEQVKTRISTRNFIKNKKMEEKHFNDILTTIDRAPVSNNYFMSSAIVINDVQLLHKIGTILNQKQVAESSIFILFLADNNRINEVYKLNNTKHEFNSLNSILTGAGDAFIQATMAQDAAINNGLGTCFIGGVRAFIPELKEILNIDGDAFPCIGLAIGYFDKKIYEPKPKLNRIFMNSYDINKLKNDIKPYNTVLKAFFTNQNIEFDYINSSFSSLNKAKKDVDLDLIESWRLKK